MDVLFPILAIAGVIGYAIVVAIGIEQGKPWAIEIAKAMSAMDPGWHAGRLQDVPPPAISSESVPAKDRLAA